MDYIFKMSDNILSKIIASLSVKEDTLKTSVLLNRWSNVWSFKKDLNFHVHNILGSEEELLQLGYLTDDIDDHEYGMVNYWIKLSTCRGEFVKRVDQFLKDFQGTKIDAFVMNFYLDSEHNRNIDEWIRFALARGVERIDLLFFSMPYAQLDDTGHETYEFPFGLFSELSNAASNHLKSICLERCFVHHPSSFDFTPFSNLRSLKLADVEVHETFIPSLLSHCEYLEELTLCHCHFESPSIPKIVSSSLCHLKLSTCFVPYDIIVEKLVDLTSVDCIKLTTLELDGNLEDMSINAPLLKSLKCNVHYNQIPYAFAFFATTFPQFETLHLDVYIFLEKDSKGKCFNYEEIQITHSLKHLKQLNIIVEDLLQEEQLDLLWILAILKACPLLQKLSVMVKSPKFCIEDHNDMKDHEMFSHDEVKVIEMGGCVGNWYEIEFVVNNLKCAHNLAQIVMSPHWREDDSDEWKSNPIWFQNGRERVRQQLQVSGVGRAELILL